MKAINFIEPSMIGANDEHTGNRYDIDYYKTNQKYGCYEGCTNCVFCAKLIQLNNWKIPKDYPW